MMADASQQPDIVVFDIGGVLVDWDPALAWSHEIGEDAARAFLERINFEKINLAGDAGASFATAAQDIADPADGALLAKYIANYTRTVPDKITGTWDILYELQSRGTTLHAITNWSAEAWPEGLKVHPELGEVFEVTVVSGEVGIIKPSLAIYRLLCDRAGVAPERCVFIDDALHNCIGAKAAGMDAIHFTAPDALRAALTERGLL